jgi:hypothetical protein
MPNAEAIMGFLKELKDKDSSIGACMVAKKGLEGLIMFPEDFKDEVSTVWEPLSNNLDDMLDIVGRYSMLGLGRLYSEVLGFGIFFLPLPMSDTALIVFVKGEDPIKDASRLMEEMEATKKRILESY